MRLPPQLLNCKSWMQQRLLNQWQLLKLQTSRLKCKYALPNLKAGGYFIAYKSKKALDELKEAENTLQTTGAKVVDIINYTLPLEEVYERNLIIVKKDKEFSN